MKTEEEKQTWVTPEIVDLDVKETKSGSVEDNVETKYTFNAYS